MISLFMVLHNVKLSLVSHQLASEFLRCTNTDEAADSAFWPTSRGRLDELDEHGVCTFLVKSILLKCIFWESDYVNGRCPRAPQAECILNLQLDALSPSASYGICSSTPGSMSRTQAYTTTRPTSVTTRSVLQRYDEPSLSVLDH